jgi:hypothetical protein
MPIPTGHLPGAEEIWSTSTTRAPFTTGLNLANAVYGGIQAPGVIDGAASGAFRDFQQAAGEVDTSLTPQIFAREGAARADPRISESNLIRDQIAGRFAPSSVVDQLRTSGGEMLGPSSLGGELQQSGQAQLGEQGALEAALQQQALGGLSGEFTQQQQTALQAEQNRINRSAGQAQRRRDMSFASRGLGGGGQAIAELLAAERGRSQALSENQVGFGQRTRREALEQGRLAGGLGAQRRASALSEIGMGTDIGSLQSQEARARIGLGENIEAGRFGQGLGAGQLASNIRATEFGQGMEALGEGFGQEVTQAGLLGNVAQQAANLDRQQQNAQMQSFYAQMGLSQSVIDTIMRQQGFAPTASTDINVGASELAGV